ncbi:MAG: ABC transporter permease [Woeseiaceae bacterium]
MQRFWQLLALTIAGVMLAPVFVALGSVFSSAGEVWQHISVYVLPRVALNTLLLVVAVALMTLLIGTVAGWLTAVCEFPGRRFFAWSLMLPLAIPGYVIAFALAGIFQYGAPLATGLRSLGIELPEFNAGSASALCLALTLYPYVFLLARQAFMTQGAQGLEVAQSLGMSKTRGFFMVALPLARPWLVAGVALVIMETLADFGTVKVFNFDTFTTAIYSAWFGLFSLTAALQMSVMLLALVLVALVLERRARGQRRFSTTQVKSAQPRIALNGGRRIAATMFCVVLFVLAFALPVVQLLVWAMNHFQQELSQRYLTFLRASLVLSGLACGLITGLSVLLGFSRRQSPGKITATSERLATLGYALPGTVLAVGFFVALAGLQQALTGGLRLLTGNPESVVMLTGTLWVMVLAYAARFLAVAHSPVGSAFERVTPPIDDAARGLGVRGWALLKRVYLPILRPGMATALLLVFVDVMKELPITLITRPFGWDTLAVRIFQMTTEGEWERASVPALAIVICGLLPVLWLHKRSVRHEVSA